MPLNPKLLGTALHEDLTRHSTLCRREAGAFVKALEVSAAGGEQLVVACTQESRLFVDLAQQTSVTSSVSPIKFVNIRETGGWGREAAKAMPKIAALLAVAHLPDPEPVPTVTYKSAGRLLILGPLGAAEAVAALLGDVLEVSIFSTGGVAGQGDSMAGGAQERRYPVLAGSAVSLTGWLGAFAFTWRRDNPIDLDVCTRCNACLSACPEGAIGLDYQIDSALCQSHRACVAVCGVAGAIDFTREPESESQAFDLVLDLRTNASPQSTFLQHAPPQGYFRAGAMGVDAQTLIALRGLVGEFEKAKFFTYKQKLCAHSRNTTVGCSACIDICSAKAISSEPKRQQISVNPNLCVGCGACTTVCPTGALGFAYPRTHEQGLKLKTLLTTYTAAGGQDAVLLLHSQGAGQTRIEQLGRAAQLKKARGVPANVIPVALWHTASTGLDLWLSAIAFGARAVAVLLTDEEAPQYVQGLREQMAVGQALLNGLGYSGVHLHLLDGVTNGQHNGQSLAALDASLQALASATAQVVHQPARFAVTAEKRSTLELALDHLITQAPTPLAALPEAIALPSAGSPFGSVVVNKEKCTLCLACVSACPASALADNPNSPQLRFTEKNCVQCGLCAQTCPEDAIALMPRLLLTPQRKDILVLNEMRPYACVRCSKPFGTLKAIEGMLGKLAGHAMFQGAALERLKMCGDCRVIDLYSADNEARITDL